MPSDYEYRKVIFHDISWLQKFAENQMFTKIIFSEYQKKSLTETKCLRIVYAEFRENRRF